MSFPCDEGAERPETPFRRLSHNEYETTLRDLISRSVRNDVADLVFASIRGPLSALPPDSQTVEQPFARMDQAMSQQHVDTYFRIGSTVASTLTGSPDRVAALLGDCASAADPSAAGACIESFIKSFGRRALRHSLSSAEIDFFLEVYGASGIDARGLSDVIAVMLNSPSFLLQIELGGDAVSGKENTYELTGFELASRLSFWLWQSAPDDELLDAAERGDLDSDEGYRAELERMLDDPRAKETLGRFLREWFSLDTMRPLDALIGDPVYDAFAEGMAPTPDLREDMLQEVASSLTYHALDRDGSLHSWIESPYSFARTEMLANIYGVEPWDGQSEPPTFPEGTRAGLITRAALLTTGTANTRPIMKGVFLRERLLCDDIAPPPANAANVPPELSPTQTTRQVVEALTEQKGSACAGCHSVQINALGFATESFDALARARETQRLFDKEGGLIAEKPVDVKVVPRVWLEDETEIEGASELATLIADSGKVEACFARQFFRFVSARNEDEELDGCDLEAMREPLTEGKSLRQTLLDFLSRDSLRQRHVSGGV